MILNEDVDHSATVEKDRSIYYRCNHKLN